LRFYQAFKGIVKQECVFIIPSIFSIRGTGKCQGKNDGQAEEGI
jgi:hypothetical protein